MNDGKAFAAFVFKKNEEEIEMRFVKTMAAALTAATLVSLAGCGNAGGTTESPTAAESGEKTTTAAGSGGNSSDVTLTVAIWDKNQEPGLKEIMNDFTEETGIKTDIQITPWKDYWTMLEAATTGGNMPDVFWMHSQQVGTYAQYDDVLLDLTEKIEKSDKVDLSKYQQDVVALYQRADGSQIGVPKDVDTAAVWYNKDMFDEA